MSKTKKTYTAQWNSHQKTREAIARAKSQTGSDSTYSKKTKFLKVNGKEIY